MFTICHKGVKYPKTLVTISQLTLIGINSFFYYQRSKGSTESTRKTYSLWKWRTNRKKSQLVDHFIGPLVPLSQSYIRDSTHLINIPYKFIVQPGILLCMLDITSLYTNIPHNEGIQSNKEMLAIHKLPNSLPQNSYIIELLEVVLINNHFEFNGKLYHQVSGTAMGTKLSHSYTNVFMTKVEEEYVCTYPLQPKLWKRFIDDIFLIWPHGMDSLLEFINHLNTLHFTKDISCTEISFLDLTIYIKECKLYTRLHTKTTARHMYQNYFLEPEEVYTIFTVPQT